MCRDQMWTRCEISLRFRLLLYNFPDETKYSYSTLHTELRDILESIQNVTDSSELFLCDAWLQLNAAYLRVNELAKRVKPFSLLELVLYLGSYDSEY